MTLQFKSCDNLLTEIKLVHNLGTYTIFLRTITGLSLISTLLAILLREPSAMIIFLLLEYRSYLQQYLEVLVI